MVKVKFNNVELGQYINKKDQDCCNNCFEFIKTLHYNNKSILTLIVDIEHINNLTEKRLNYYYKTIKKLGISFNIKKFNNRWEINIPTSKNNNSSYIMFKWFTFIRFPFQYRIYFNLILDNFKLLRTRYTKENPFLLLVVCHAIFGYNTSPKGFVSPPMFGFVNNLETCKKKLLQNGLVNDIFFNRPLYNKYCCLSCTAPNSPHNINKKISELSRKYTSSNNIIDFYKEYKKLTKDL